jgi:hypothetical protein
VQLSGQPPFTAGGAVAVGGLRAGGWLDPEGLAAFRQAAACVAHGMPFCMALHVRPKVGY